MKTLWFKHENTSVLLVKKTNNLIPEWEAVGQVTLRQVYEAIPAQWYAWFFCEADIGVGKFNTQEEAKQALLDHLKGDAQR